MKIAKIAVAAALVGLTSIQTLAVPVAYQFTMSAVSGNNFGVTVPATFIGSFAVDSTFLLQADGNYSGAAISGLTVVIGTQTYSQATAFNSNIQGIKLQGHKIVGISMNWSQTPAGSSGPYMQWSQSDGSWEAGSTVGQPGVDILRGTVTFQGPPLPYLAVTKTHIGNFTQGQIGAIFTITVSNAGTDPTTGTVTLIDTLPAGYSLNSFSGTGWNCTGTTTVTCTSTQVVAGSGAYNTLTLVVNVPLNSAVSVSNTAAAYGAGDPLHVALASAAVSNTDVVTVIQVPASIVLTAGNNQSTQINTAFATTLQATVLDAALVAISSYPVTFTAPGVGASGKFANTTITTSTTTNVAGLATATTFTANGTVGGPYNVSVTAGAASNNFQLTNLKATQTINFPQPPDTMLSAGPVSLTATATPSGLTVSFISNSPGVCTVSGASVTLVSLGTCSITASQAGDANYNPATSVTKTFLVTPTSPMITSQPGNQTVCAGNTATFTAAASGAPTPAVQWQVSVASGPFVNIPGANSTTLNITGTTAAQSGNRYQAVFSNAGGTAITNIATLTVNTAPVVTLAPTNQTVNEGQLVTFTAAASGSPAPTVQWQRSINGGPFVNIPGATALTYSFIATQAETKNNYNAVFTNPCGSVATDPAIFINIPFDSFQIRYAANLTQADSVVNLSNTGVNGASITGPGFGAAAGNLCVNAYAFSPDEQLISCCSCLLTPNALASLSVTTDMINNTLTGVKPNSVVIKLVATGAGADFTSGSCTNSAALAGTPGFPLAPGMVAYGTTTHPSAVTETPFLRGTLSLQELASITNRCTNIVGNGSSFGICGSCRPGGLNAAK